MRLHAGGGVSNRQAIQDAVVTGWKCICYLWADFESKHRIPLAHARAGCSCAMHWKRATQCRHPNTKFVFPGTAAAVCNANLEQDVTCTQTRTARLLLPTASPPSLILRRARHRGAAADANKQGVLRLEFGSSIPPIACARDPLTASLTCLFLMATARGQLARNGSHSLLIS